MKTDRQFLASNRQCASRRWPKLPETTLCKLDSYLQRFGFCVENGDLILLENNWYVTHTGLIRLARTCKCTGIEVRPIRAFCDHLLSRWVFRSVVYPTCKSRGFSGYGDADPSNVSPALRGAEMRIAETRAVNRALRKAYGIGLCSVEELDSSLVPPPNGHVKRAPTRFGANLEVITPIPLRDQLRQLIRQQRLDPALTKSYALNHLGVVSFHQATREQVNELITHLHKRLFEDRDRFLSDLLKFASQPTNKEVA